MSDSAASGTPAGAEIGTSTKALALTIRTLERYPAPVPAGAIGHVRYVPALDVAMDLYAGRFQRSPEEETIVSAFAAIVPRILERGQALIGTIMDAVVDGGAAPEAQADYATVLHDLGTLATVFAGSTGEACAPHYAAVCEMIQALLEVAPK